MMHSRISTFFLTGAVVPILVAACASKHPSMATRSVAGTAKQSSLTQAPASPLRLPASIPRPGESPSSVTVDGSGNIYVGLRGNSSNTSDVAAFDHAGNFIRVFGAGLYGAVPLVAVGPDHNVYVWATDNFEPIRVYTPEGALVRKIVLPSSVVRLTDLELDSAGKLFATGYDNNGSSWKVFRFDSAGKLAASFTAGPAGDPLVGLAIDPDGTLWVTRHSGDSVLVHLDADGRELPKGPDLAALAPSISTFDVDAANGLLYIVGFGEATAPAKEQGKVVLLTLAPGGTLLNEVIADQLANYCCGDDTYTVAVSGSDIWVTGMDTSKLASLSVGAGSLNGRPIIGHLTQRGSA
jgi:hypothetical protein